MADWQPNPQHLQGIVELMTAATSGHDTATQRMVLDKINSAKKEVVDFACYLVYILVHLKQAATPMRQLSGLELKNQIRGSWVTTHDGVKEYIRSKLAEVLADESSHVRTTAGSCITSIIEADGAEGFKAWPQLLPMLLHLLQSENANAIEGGLSCLYKLCEDHHRKLDSEDIGRPLNTIIPALISVSNHPVEAYKKYCISALLPFVFLGPQALMVNMDAYLQMLFRLAQDESKEVRRRVCHSLVAMAENKLQYLVPHMEEVVEYMFRSTQEQDEFVALEACDFWNALCEIKQAHPLLEKNLDRLVPVLLKGMVYSDLELSAMGEEVLAADNCDVEDRPQDIRPHVGGVGQLRTFVPSGSGGGQQQPGDESDEDVSDDEDWDDGSGQWNFRRCSASALDQLATLFPVKILPSLLPQLNQVFGNPNSDWRYREASVLALGAIADGCMEQMSTHLPNLLPFLYQLASGDQMPLVRSISCWTIGRYAQWLRRDEAASFLAPAVEVILGRMLDRNKKVQEAACSALATLEEEVATGLIPLLGGILPVLQRCFDFYKAKNMLILYDAVGTLCDSVKGALATPELAPTLLNPLIQAWNTVPDDSMDLPPLLECLTSVAPALGQHFQSFAPAVYERMIRILQKYLADEETFYNGASNYEPEPEIVHHAVEVISALCESLGTSMESLIGQSTLCALLPALAQHPRNDVRIAVFGLIGDLARFAYPHLEIHIPNVALSLAKNIWPPTNQTVSINAVWALGEVAVKAGPQFANSVNTQFDPQYPSVYRALTLILDGELTFALTNNAAITLGRFAMFAPQLIAGLLNETFRTWLLALSRLPENPEKDNAFRGLCEVVKANPQGVIPFFPHMCQAIASWDPNHIAPDLNENFKQILIQFKGAIGEGWGEYFSKFPQDLQAKLVQRYGL
eukprot:TRINITY_DN242_c0_g2_i2.p1 TRINITY_DN242_c0_g2~~TRINITY_DN242_c0_g2_i2.p1  ORF type:complete len:916 (-),score=202.16 TRINITY_DN242_c0_g2_i2:452-3199(-)